MGDVWVISVGKISAKSPTVWARLLRRRLFKKNSRSGKVNKWERGKCGHAPKGISREGCCGESRERG
jgi:hypothetical protein